MHHARVLVVAVVAVFAFLPSTADAAQLCVGTPVFCTSGINYPATPAGLTQATADADNEALYPGYDSVVVQAGTYVFAGGLSIAPDHSVKLTGEGEGQTIIEATDPGATALEFDGSGCSSCRVEELTVRSTSGAAAGNSALVLDDVDGRELGVLQNDATAVAAAAFNGATLGGSHISVAAGGDSAGVVFGSGSGALFESTVSGAKTGVVVVAGTASVRDTLIEIGGASNAIGVLADHPNADAVTITANVLRSTIAGSGPNQTGVWIESENADQVVEANVAGTLVLLTGSDRDAFYCEASGTGDGAIDVTYSAFDLAAVTEDGCPVVESGSINAATTDLKLTNAYASAYRPYFGSPLIDATDPADVLGGVTDATNKLRTKDGNGDGTVRADIGAFEYQRTSPKYKRHSVISLGGGLKELSTTFEDADGEPLSIAWDFGDGEHGNGSPVRHKYTYENEYDAAATATDPAGLTTARRFFVSSEGDPQFRPKLTLARRTITGKISRKRKFSLSRKRARGAVKVTVAVDGKVTATAIKLVDGVVDKGKCRLRKRRERGGRSCKVKRLTGETITYKLPAVIHWLQPGGVFGRTKLAAGEYEVVLVGRDPRNNETDEDSLRFELK